MPIHFSIGFVAEVTPRRQFEAVCAFAYVEQGVMSLAHVVCEVEASALVVKDVTALWKREYGDCK